MTKLYFEMLHLILNVMHVYILCNLSYYIFFSTEKEENQTYTTNYKTQIVLNVNNSDNLLVWQMFQTAPVCLYIVFF